MALPMSLIDLEQHINDIYTETARRVLDYTPQLFTIKDVEAKTIQSHGSSVLIKTPYSHYMVTAMHCVQQNNVRGKIGVLNGAGQLRLLSGPMVLNNGVNSEIDLALIKLDPASVEVLSESYKFLDMAKVRPNSNIPGETNFLIVGYPSSQTSIDNVKRTLKWTPLVHIGKSVPEEAYETILFKNPKTKERYNLKKTSNTLISYNRRKSRIIGTQEMSMSPYPKGISGCGVWYIQSYEIADPKQADFYLMGIIIEFDEVKRMLIATKTEELASLLQASINKVGK